MAIQSTSLSRSPIQYEVSNGKNSVEDVQEMDTSLQEEYKSLLRSYNNSVEKVFENGGMAQYLINLSHGQLHRFTKAHPFPEFKLPARHIAPVYEPCRKMESLTRRWRSTYES